MPISDKDRINNAYDAIFSAYKKEIKMMNKKLNGLLDDMEDITIQLMQLHNNSNDPVITDKFRKMLSDSEVVHFYQSLQIMKNIPRRIEEDNKTPKK